MLINVLGLEQHFTLSPDRMHGKPRVMFVLNACTTKVTDPNAPLGTGGQGQHRRGI